MFESSAVDHRAVSPSSLTPSRAAWTMMTGLMLTLGVGIVSCDDTPEQSAPGATPIARTLPTLELTDNTQNLLLTWVDEKGDFHVVQKIGDVPEGSREAVRVVITDREDGTGTLVYVADLRQANAQGVYPVKTMTRAQWDELGANRRQARLEALAPSPSSSGAAPGSSNRPPPSKDKKAVQAIVYGAEWCKPCHQAEAYLKRRGVSVTKKDIEEDPLAAREMRQKLEKANQSGASIPIIDVMGRLLVGYDPRALDRAVQAARKVESL